MATLDRPDQIEAYRIASLKTMLSLEVVGMRRRGRSAATIVKAEFGLKGSNQKVYDEFICISEQYTGEVLAENERLAAQRLGVSLN